MPDDLYLSDSLVANDSIAVRHPRFHSIRSKLKAADLFGFTPAPRFVHEKQVSLRGLIGSIVAVLLLGAYMGVAINRFLTGSPTISQVQEPPTADMLPFVPTGIVFRRNDPKTLAPSLIFYNESYFKFVSSITNVTEQDRYPRSIHNIPMEQCNLSSWAGWLGSSAHCPSEQFLIRGRYQSHDYTFSRIDVVTCDPANPYNASDGSGPVTQCAPAAAIQAVLMEGRFNLLQIFDDSVTDANDVWEANMFLLDPSKWQLYEQSYAVRTITKGADYLRSWIDAASSTFSMTSEKFYSRAVAKAPQGGTYVLTVYFRLGSFNINESRQLQTSGGRSLD